MDDKQKKKRKNPKRAGHKENMFSLWSFFSFYYIYMRRQMLAEPTVIIISHIHKVSHHDVLLELIQWYVSINFQQNWKQLFQNKLKYLKTGILNK